MKRIDLSRGLAKATAMTLGEADRIVLAFIGAIRAGVQEDGRVCIVGFGSFTVRDCPPKRIPDPNTGRMITVPAKKKIRFRAGKHLTKLVNV